MVKKDVSVKQETALSTPQPMTGMENITGEDILIPRVKVIYSLSSEMKDKELRDTLKQGMIINTNTKEEIKNPNFAVLNFFKMYAKFNPMQPNARGFNAKLPPGATDFVAYTKDDPRINPQDLEWTDGMPPLVAAMRGFLVLFDGDDMPCVLSFFRSSAKSGKELATQIFVPGKPAWDKKFKLYTEEKTDKGVYYILKTRPIGKTSDEEKAKCHQMYDMFSKHAHKAVEEEVKGGVEVPATEEGKRPY